MTTRDNGHGGLPGRDAMVPVGTEADEQQDDAAVLADATASADEDALADAGLSQGGGPGQDHPTPDGSGAPSTRRPEQRSRLSSRLYNGEAGLDVVGRSRLIYKVTGV